MRIAAQMYTLREETKTAEGFENALITLHGIGYEGVQLSAIGCMNGETPEVDAKRARELLDDNGLVCCATHRPITRLLNHLEEEIEFHQTLGCDYIAIGGIGWDYGDTPDAYRRFLDDTRGMMARLREVGIAFGYHNHDYEFIRDPETGRPCYEILVDEPDLQLEIDTYWVVHAGLDVVGLLARAAGRIDVIHFKDREVVSKVGPVMAPVGEGLLDWDAIIEACAAGGTRWAVVEQDECRRNPFDCLASSFEYLQAKLS